MDTNSVAIIGTIASIGALIWAIFEFFVPFLKNLRDKKLLEEKISMGPYTKNIIKDAQKYYVRPKCSLVDPTHSYTKEITINSSKRWDLFLETENFIRQGEHKKFLLLLADSGMGKTSFILNFYAYNGKLPKKKQHKIKLVSLGIPNAEASILDESIPHEDTIIFLDAFDEDTKAINNHQERILELLKMCLRYKKVIITSRSQFFPKESDIPNETKILRIGPVNAGAQKQYDIDKFYLLPFDNNEINKYISNRFPHFDKEERERAIKIISKIPSLSIRPMLLAYIPDLLKISPTITKTYELFEVMIDGWLERELVWVDKNSLRQFSERLAVNIYRNRMTRGSETITKEELIILSNMWKIKIENWKLTSRSLLNRDANDNFKFAHRSIMEFLFVQSLFRMDPDCYWVELTDQMTSFVGEIFEWNDSIKATIGNNVKFLGADLLQKIVDMHNKITEENYEQFMRIVDGIKFLELVGVFLNTLDNQEDVKLHKFGVLGREFDKIIEKENLGIFGVQASYLRQRKLNLNGSANPSQELMQYLSKKLSEQMGISENVINQALLFRTPSKTFLIQLLNLIDGEKHTQNSGLSIINLINSNVKMYSKGALMVPIFTKNNIFSEFNILLLRKFDISHFN